MKVLEFTIESLNRVVYEIQKVAIEFQKAKEEYEILDENEKDFLATLKVKISSGVDISNVEAETQVRASYDWKVFKEGKYQAKRKLGEVGSIYKHLLRVMNCIERGLSYNQTLLKARVHDVGGK